jgi:hypothetical protein
MLFHKGESCMTPRLTKSSTNTSDSFILKTKEQRAAEKAMSDKSPEKTLTLEEFLESERHRLVGTLTPVTPETFAEWKKKRMDKKAAEEQARKAKEATGRTLFESGNWRTEGDDEASDDEDSDVWNLQKMREETERIRQKKEDERLAKEYGIPYLNGEPVSGDATTEEMAGAAQPPLAPATLMDTAATAAT